jgi:hypothetical protein
MRWFKVRPPSSWPSWVLALVIDAGIFILACEVTDKVAPPRRRAVRWWWPK